MNADTSAIKLLQESRQRVMADWTGLVAVERKKSGWIEEIFWRLNLWLGIWVGKNKEGGKRKSSLTNSQVLGMNK